MYLVHMCSPTLGQRPIVNSHTDFCPGLVYNSLVYSAIPGCISSPSFQSQPYHLRNSSTLCPVANSLTQENLPYSEGLGRLEPLTLTIPCVGEELTYIACGRRNCIKDSGKVLAGSIKQKRHIQYDLVILLWLV